MNYLEKLEAEKRNYMELPVSLGSMEMIREIEKTKECLCNDADGELTKEDAMSWMYNMKNEDGSYGAHWEIEQTRPFMARAVSPAMRGSGPL